MLATLRHRNFALVWAAGFLGLLSTWAFFTVLPLFVFGATGSALLSGLALAASALPSIVIGPVAGVLVDRWSRPRVMLWANVLQAGVLAGFAALSRLDALWLGYAAVLALATLTSFTSPAESALLPSLVEPDRLVSANALNGLNDNLARIIGPVVGTLVYAQAGFTAVGLLGAGAFLLAAFLISRMRLPAPPAETPVPAANGADDATADVAAAASGWRHELGAGLAAVRGHPLLLATFVVLGMVALADAPLSAILVPFVERSLKVGPEGFGMLLSVRGVAGVLGGLVLAQFGLHLRPDRLVGVGCVVVGGGIILMGLLPSFGVTLSILLVLGPAIAAMQTGTATLLQQGAPDQVRGRVFALLGAFSGVIWLAGTIAAGALGERWAPPWIVLLAGALYLVAGAVALTLLAGRARAAATAS